MKRLLSKISLSEVMIIILFLVLVLIVWFYFDRMISATGAFFMKSSFHLTHSTNLPTL